MSTTSRVTLSNTGRQLVEAQYDAFVAVLDRLEDPRDRWAPRTITAEGVDPADDPLAQHVHRHMRRWHREQLLERAEYFEGDTPSYHGQPVRFTRACLARIDAHAPKGVELPCGHHAFENLRDGGYGCGAEWCAAEFTREEVQASLEGL